MQPSSVRKTIMPKQPVRPLGGIAGTPYRSFMRGQGASNPLPTKRPPKPRRAVPMKRAPVMRGQKDVGGGMAKGVVIAGRGGLKR